MPAADPGVSFKNQLRMSIGLVREMATVATGKTSDPIQLPNNGVRAEMKQIYIFAEREMPNAGIFFHDQAARTNPGQADPAGGMNRIAELLFENAAPGRPGQQDREEHQELIQHAGTSERYNSRYSEIMRAAEKRFAFSSAESLQRLRSSKSTKRIKSATKLSSSSGSCSIAPAPAPSDIGPAELLTTGQPQACASIIGQPNPSKRDG